MTDEIERLRAALRAITECPRPDSIEECHDVMWDIAFEALRTDREASDG